MKDGAWFCAHRYKWKLTGNRWKCKRWKKIERYHKPRIWISGLRKTRKFSRNLSGILSWVTLLIVFAFEGPVSIKSIQHLFKIIREAIYQESLQELSHLSGKLEMDATMFGGKRPGKRGWGAEGKVIV